MNFKQVAAAAITVAFSTASPAAVLLSEGFDNVSALTGAGWVIQNLSSPVGSDTWSQGNAGIFEAAAGAPDAYIAANYLGAAPGGTISNWLMTPELSLALPTTLELKARVAGDGVLDTLEIYYSTSGASTSIADFSLLGSYAAETDQDWLDLLFTVAAAAAVAAAAGLPAGAWADEGLTVVRDRETGALRAPTAAEAAELRNARPAARALRQASEPRVRRLANGAGQASVPESFTVFSVVQKRADGTLERQCVQGEEQASAATLPAFAERVKTTTTAARTSRGMAYEEQ